MTEYRLVFSLVPSQDEIDRIGTLAIFSAEELRHDGIRVVADGLSTTRDL